jgi:Family of unknown function (DUF6328)
MTPMTSTVSNHDAAHTVDWHQHRTRAHGETTHQRLTRNYAELLQEVRVAQTGTQLLLAFLLTLAFTPRFGALTDFQRQVYVTSLVIGAAATALLIAPAAFHRVVFQRGLRHALVTYSNRFAYFGLILLMCALSSALLLILDVVLGAPRSIWITGAIASWFGVWWYAIPMWNRARHRPVMPRDTGDGVVTSLRALPTPSKSD